MSAPGAPAPPGRIGRLLQGLRRTREGILGRLGSAFRGGPTAKDWGEDLEAALIQADLGPQATARIVEAVRGAAAAGAPPSWEEVRRSARRVLRDILVRDPVAETGVATGSSAAAAPDPAVGAGGGERPRVIVCVGVNGSGKTTTAGKLAWRLQQEGRTALLCAADTFRAAAGEQLRIWADRAGAEFVGGGPGADPSAVVFDALGAARSRGRDAVIIDTAGRLHTREPLMRELEKVVRVAGRQVPGAPHEVLLVLDATTGQNGVQQARQFLAAARVTGLVVTKLDGTARGGVAIRIVQELGIPLRYVGVGEGAADLVDFDADEFLEGLLPSAA